MPSEAPSPDSPQVLLRAEREVAYASPDHQVPWGTRRDNSRNRRFNDKLYRLFPGQDEPLRVLDLGCSGGGFVRDCLDDGCLAIGLEGSDYSKKRRRAEWAVIPDFLFTCDVTADYELLLRGPETTERLEFDVITSWELIEHIAENDLAGVAANVKKHLRPTGLWIMSVSPNEEIIGGLRLHQTVKPEQWWIDKFAGLGFTNLPGVVRYFGTQFVRGPKYGAPGSFHLALTPHASQAPPIPPRALRERVYDRWLGSGAQVFLRQLIVGRS